MTGSRLARLGQMVILLPIGFILLFAVFGLPQIWNGNSEGALIAKADSHGDGDPDDDTDDTDGSEDSSDSDDTGDSGDTSDTGDSGDTSDSDDTDTTT